MFIIGVIILVNSSRKTFGLILTVIGGLLLLNKIFPTFHIGGEVIFPLVLIILGMFIIIRRRSYPEGLGSKESISKDFIDDVAIFGGGTKIINSDNFKGGNITAIFGGAEIDLTNSKLAEGNNVLDVVTIFGGAEIRVPSDWNIILNVTPIFGGFSNKVRQEPGVAVDQTRTLIVKGVAIFGGGEIKSK